MCIFRGFFAKDEEGDEIEMQERRLPQYLRDDGIRRVAKLNAKNFKKTLKQTRMLVVLFYVTNNENPEADKVWRTDEQMLEIVARILQPQGVTIGSLNVRENLALAQELGVMYAGSILIFHRGKSVEYVGHRSADVLVSFLHRMFEVPVTLVETKKQRKIFEDVDTAKVIGYFPDKTCQEFKTFEEAAKQYQPLLPFFAVFDKKLAKGMRLKKLGNIQLNKPYEKAANFPSEQPLTEGNLHNFIKTNRRQFLTKMRLEDIHQSWPTKAQSYLVVTAFVRPQTEDGSRFFSLIKSLARSYANNKKLTFVWIDPEPFPMMRDFWQKSYEIDVNKPTLGVIDPKTNQNAWFKSARAPKLRQMTKWVDDILAEKIQLKGKNSTDSTDQKKDEL